MLLPRVAIHIPFMSAYCRQVLRGVADYVQKEAAWLLVGNPVYDAADRPVAAPGREPDRLIDAVDRRTSVEAGVDRRPREGGVDGVLIHCTDPAEAQWYEAFGVPAVNVTSLLPEVGLARVCVDNGAIGRLGAMHLLEQGVAHLAYIEPGFGPRFDARRLGFVEAAAERGVTAATYRSAGQWEAGRWVDQEAGPELDVFIDALPRPCGLMAPHDALAVHIMSTAQRMGLVIPDDLIVLGVGNDELFCDFADPPLSSIDVNARLIGREAAKLLDRLLGEARAPAGRAGASGRLLTGRVIAPAHVAARESTDRMMVRDAMVAQAMRLIRRHAARGAGVREIVSQLPVSRRAFERRFRAVVGCSPHARIQQVRVEAAADLLATTDLPLRVIAERSGFADARHLGKVFCAVHSQTPGAYRRSHRQAAAAGFTSTG